MSPTSQYDCMSESGGESALAQRQSAMHHFVTQLQIIAGDIGRLSPVDLVERFEQLASAVPSPSSRVEQLAIGELLHQALTRLHRALRYDCLPIDASRLDVGAFRAAVARARDIRPIGTPSRLIEFHRILRRRYADVRLSAIKIAAEMNMSSSHLIRILRRETGHGFPWHLRRIRMLEAIRLLKDSAFSIKEISSRIGYPHTSQFDRHFRAAYGVTPSAYRRWPHPAPQVPGAVIGNRTHESSIESSCA